MPQLHYFRRSGQVHPYDRYRANKSKQNRRVPRLHAYIQAHPITLVGTVLRVDELFADSAA